MIIKPVSDRDSALQQHDKHKLSNPSLCRILLVEDNPANLLVASTLIEMFGYEFDVAETGYDAVEKAKTGLYKIVIMGMRMPDINGVEAVRLIREYERSHAKPAVQILCVTADALAGEHERCLAAEMNDYLAKPYKTEEFRHKLFMLSQN